VLTGAAQRFAADWARIGPDRAPVGLAVSGGPDSMALLLLAHAALGPQRLAVATVDHGLRDGSAAEAALVATVCADLGVRHSTLTLALAAGSAVQERARDARYAALAQWCRDHALTALVTAHHADDQAETMVMRLNRGAGLRGLAAMRPRAAVPHGQGLDLLRPLLGWRRADLAALVAACGTPVVDDPSNRSGRFERARVRQGLAAAPWLDPAGLAATAAHLADADAALDWMADRLIEPALTCEPALPRALALRVLERVIARIGRGPARGSAIAAWHDRLLAGRIATLAGVRGDGRHTPWRFTPVAPHRGDRTDRS
jgi:tRNA(Ile)-lysidine synthase